MIQRERQGSVAIVRVEHGKVNALDLELLQELHGLFQQLQDEAETRAVVFTGSGRSFSAGVDLFRILEGGPDYLEPFMKAFRDALLAIAEHPQPVVAAINGHAIAGGFLLACACDWRVMARGEGKVGIPELRVGVPLPGLAWAIVSSAVPAPTLRRLVLQGDLLSAEEALSAGLVDELVEPERLLERARARAEQFGRVPPATYRITRRQLRRPLREARESDDEAETLAVWSSPEVREAIRAYLDATLKRR